VSLGAGESLECKHLRPAKVVGSEEIIELQTPRAGEKIVLKKTGVIVEFSREEFRRSAECLGYTESVHWVDTETGGTPESPLRDAFQLSYVAASLLDVGRASVRLQDFVLLPAGQRRADERSRLTASRARGSETREERGVAAYAMSRGALPRGRALWPPFSPAAQRSRAISRNCSRDAEKTAAIHHNRHATVRAKRLRYVHAP
jgi:hypothetical protein